jgi:hypothetical protein
MTNGAHTTRTHLTPTTAASIKWLKTTFQAVVSLTPRDEVPVT